MRSPRDWSERTGWLIVIAGGVVGLAGCGAHSDRQAVSGKVTLDGVALDGGSIRFSSISAERTMASGAMINGGEYRIPQEKGLAPGTYHLEIYAPDDTAKPVVYRASPDGPGVLTQPERIPAEYNVNSSKTIEVVSGGDNQFDFAIASKRTK